MPAPDHRIVAVGDDAVGIVLAERLRFVGGADLGWVDKAVPDRLEVAERRRLLDESHEIAGEHRGIDGIRLLAHLRRDEGREVGLAEFRPLLVDDLDVGAKLFQRLDEAGDRVAAIGIVGGDRGDGLDALEPGHLRRPGEALDIGVRGNAENVRVNMLWVRQDRALRRRGDEDDLVFLGDRRYRRRLGRSQGADEEIDVVLDDQFAGKAHRLIGVRLAVARQQLELAAKHAASGVDLGHRHLGAFQDRFAVNRGRSRQGDRKPDLDRLICRCGKRGEGSGGAGQRQNMSAEHPFLPILSSRSPNRMAAVICLARPISVKRAAPIINPANRRGGCGTLPLPQSRRRREGGAFCRTAPSTRGDELVRQSFERQIYSHQHGEGDENRKEHDPHPGGWAKQRDRCLETACEDRASEHFLFHFPNYPLEKSLVHRRPYA